jgi:hypothetical protein
MEPRVETGTSKGMNRESGTERNAETEERFEKGRAERMTETFDGDFLTGDSVSFCSEVSGVEVICTVVYDTHGSLILLFDPQNEK